MSIKFGGWVHGNALHVQDPLWPAFRQGFWTTVRPSNQNTSGWVHFAVPTPTVFEGANTKAGAVMLRFTTGPKASIEAIDVWNGENQIFHIDKTYKGKLQFVRETIPNQPEVQWGVGISILVKFDGHGPETWIDLIGAGVDFF